ncbi:endonuclease/exonuclease/phosphatase family protein [Asticcacaulis sp. ZE23SCel15]|uniref:endonuclease/exonuclease/phosphatase family protein n=1 Tax=Asticcacaulis sp. ZE23SCel15 TaxID=3059027 RepID=UPI00265EF126|nr:endonuclease/exonuclease/phosphatase family protein [Asticcacaulis sp. ZE23SCel15]WKL57448.1 endonuclease/exonuclease/phosphatase family protein [Asticcacaulis sp. ZE23SCel15]
MLITRLFQILCFLAAATLLGVGVMVALNPAGRELYLIDIFTLPLLSGTACFAVLMLLLRRHVACLMTFTACLAMGIGFWPTALPAGNPAATDAKPVRVMFANLWVNNKTPERLADWVTQTSPDIVVYIEDGPRAEERLMPLMKAQYPYHFETWDSHVFSRYPLTHAKGYIDHRNLHRVDVMAPQGRFTLLVTHFTRPWPFQPPAAQVKQRDFLADYLHKSTDDATLIVGDFNSAPHARLLDVLMKEQRLHVAASLGGTWPARLPVPLRVNIDNALARDGLHMSPKTIGPYYGSDHLPIMVEVTPIRPKP